MPADLATSVGTTRLKNPLIAGSAEHLIEPAGIRAALAAGAAAVVVKSTNESEAARQQLRRAEYALLDERWRRIAWNGAAPRSATVACRSGLTPVPFAAWLEQTAALDREARAHDAYVVASIVMGELEPALAMARRIEQAGIRLLEFNIGTPYAREAARGAVATELDPARVRLIVEALRAAVAMPFWIKITGQSEKVPDLAAAAFEAGTDAVTMAGRLLGLVPDLETCAPVLGTSLGVGGFWNLPMTCHWLALSRARLGPGRPLIGTNGVQDGLDVARLLLAGAHAVEISSPVMLRGFGLIGQALDELGGYLARKGLAAGELVGLAADRRRSFAQMDEPRESWRAHVPQEARGDAFE